MIGHRKRLALLAVVLLPALAAGAYGTPVSTQAIASENSQRTTWDSVFTAEQAEQGHALYQKACARCHRDALGGGDESPALTGSAFMSSWNGQTLDDLQDRIRTSMPTDTPGVYGRQDVVDVIAYMLQYNGFPAGLAPLPKESEALKDIRFTAQKP